VSKGLALSDAEKAIVLNILRAQLPAEVGVHVFGSRATGGEKPWSDLDLVLQGTEPLAISLLAELAEAFDESALPWKVDLVDRMAVGDDFGRLIDRSKVQLD
jgi:uncharacterized protein